MQRKILPLILFSLLALTGCSCQQRLERLQRRCPECDNRRDRLHPDVAVATALLALLFLWGIAREVRLMRKNK